MNTQSQNISEKYRGADKSLARPGRKPTTANKPADMSNNPR
jgi:hypothetical protein